MMCKKSVILLLATIFHFGDALQCYQCVSLNCINPTLIECNPAIINLTLNSVERMTNTYFKRNITLNDYKCVSADLNNTVTKKKIQFCTYNGIDICGPLRKNASSCSYCKSNRCNVLLGNKNLTASWGSPRSILKTQDQQSWGNPAYINYLETGGNSINLRVRRSPAVNLNYNYARPWGNFSRFNYSRPWNNTSYLPRKNFTLPAWRPGPYQTRRPIYQTRRPFHY